MTNNDTESKPVIQPLAELFAAAIEHRRDWALTSKLFKEAVRAAVAVARADDHPDDKPHVLGGKIEMAAQDIGLLVSNREALAAASADLLAVITPHRNDHWSFRAIDALAAALSWAARQPR